MSAKRECCKQRGKACRTGKLEDGEAKDTGGASHPLSPRLSLVLLCPVPSQWAFYQLEAHLRVDNLLITPTVFIEFLL